VSRPVRLPWRTALESSVGFAAPTQAWRKRQAETKGMVVFVTWSSGLRSASGVGGPLGAKVCGRLERSRSTYNFYKTHDIGGAHCCDATQD